MKWTLESIKGMMSGQLIMEKWDTFTVMLKDYYLEEYTNKIYMNRTLVEDETKPMKTIILETA